MKGSEEPDVRSMEATSKLLTYNVFKVSLKPNQWEKETAQGSGTDVKRVLGPRRWQSDGCWDSGTLLNSFWYGRT